MFRSQLTLMIVLFAVGQVFGQEALGQTEKKQIVDSAAKLFESYYVYPDIGSRIAKTIRDKYNNNQYDQILNPHHFSRALTEDMKLVNEDKHISIKFDPILIERYSSNQENGDDSYNEFNDQLSQFNSHYFEQVSILEGNIGYIRFKEFSDGAGVSETIASLMNFLRDTEAVIFDVRKNRGGSGYTVQLLISYFTRTSTLLNKFYERPNESIRQVWSFPLMNKYNMTEKEVIILVGPKTFSAAEGFAYTMKNLNRATVIGQATGGAAHTVDYYALNENFYAIVPTGKGINPITETNWEGTGVKPNIIIESDKALDTARLILIKNAMNNYQQDDFRQKVFNWEVNWLETILNPIALTRKQLKMFVGQYGDANIKINLDKLMFNKSSIETEIIYAGNNQFVLLGNSSSTLEFIVEDNNAMALQITYSSGNSEWLDRIE